MKRLLREILLRYFDAMHQYCASTYYWDDEAKQAVKQIRKLIEEAKEIKFRAGNAVYQNKAGKLIVKKHEDKHLRDYKTTKFDGTPRDVSEVKND